jgi:hypothetical protein
MLSATSNKGLERIIGDILGDYSILKFKSEYEMINKISNVASGTILTYNSKEEVLKAVADTI